MRFTRISFFQKYCVSVYRTRRKIRCMLVRNSRCLKFTDNRDNTEWPARRHRDVLGQNRDACQLLEYNNIIIQSDPAADGGGGASHLHTEENRRTRGGKRRKKRPPRRLRVESSDFHACPSITITRAAAHVHSSSSTSRSPIVLSLQPSYRARKPLLPRPPPRAPVFRRRSSHSDATRARVPRPGHILLRLLLLYYCIYRPIEVYATARVTK